MVETNACNVATTNFDYTSLKIQFRGYLLSVVGGAFTRDEGERSDASGGSRRYVVGLLDGRRLIAIDPVWVVSFAGAGSEVG